ncbi:MAG: hypothetical protein DKT66_13630 [Candidatus Melainabacteria bacterium]|nr:MAG: hypothetical protein DKT66_13630 [Candidatus Melainabacteria bacterium]
MCNSRRKILVVEDDKILRLTVLSQLKRLKCSGTAIVNGKEALSAIKAGKYDLILMDVQMPIYSGLEATEEIRNWEMKASRKRTPIIAMTANPNRKQCFDAGMDDYLFKPHSLSDLESIVNKWAVERRTA